MEHVDYLEYLERQFASDSGDQDIGPDFEVAIEIQIQPDEKTDWGSVAHELTPRTRLGKIFGVTRRDLDDAARTLSGDGVLFSGVKSVLKRASDVALASLVIIGLLPLIIAISLAIRLESPGPLIFAQSRVGAGNKIFPMYKFRTMSSSTPLQRFSPTIADGSGTRGPLFKLRRDPRITRVGWFLRRYSIDEIPQLINVLRGDMSIVGPRPLLPRELSPQSRFQYATLRPGMTGLWQISGRTNPSWEESLMLDRYYASNWSFVLDTMIVWRTIMIVASNPSSGES